MEIPYFDGSSKMTAQAWVQKLDTYLQLNPMREMDAIKFATMYLEGKAHDWWYHGLTTLGHNQIVAYIEFTQRLIDRFDQGDPESYISGNSPNSGRQDHQRCILRSFRG
jgi:hypothetical protein